METDNAGAVQAIYNYGNDLISMTRISGISEICGYYHYDGLGSVRQMTDSDEEDIVASYTYDGYGNLIASTGSVTNAYGFTGEQQFDEADNLIFLRARYYSPKLGRFLQPDPIGYAGGLNLYAYCLNNPIKWTDPWGLDIWVQGTWYGHQQICIGDPKGAYRAWGYYPAGLNFVGGKAVVRKDPPMRGSSVKRGVVKTTESEDRFLTKIMEDQAIRTHTDPTSDYRYIYGFRDCHSYAHTMYETFNNMLGKQSSGIINGPPTAFPSYPPYVPFLH